MLFRKKELAISVTSGGISGTLWFIIVFKVMPNVDFILTLAISLGVALLVFIAVAVAFVSYYSYKTNTMLEDNQKVLYSYYDVLYSLPQTWLASPDVDESMLEVYISYDRLQVGLFVDILKIITDLYHVNYYLIVEDYLEEEKRGYKYIHGYDESIFLKARDALTSESELYLTFAQTGNSIKIQLKSGLVPSLELKEGEIVVNINKAYITLSVTAYLLITGVSHGIKTYKEILELSHKRIQIENAQEENKLTKLKMKKMEQEIEKLQEKQKKLSPREEEDVQNAYISFYYIATECENITEIQLFPGISKDRR